MSTKTISDRGYRFPAEIIGHAVWLYHRFSLSQGQAQRFLAVHSRIISLFVMGRHHLSAKSYRSLREEAFATWREIAAQAA